MAQAKFIALEGIDGAGTTTQARRLSEALAHRGLEVVATHEPTDGRLGRACREALSAPTPPPPHAMALAFCADRFDHLARTIEPALERGAWVVCDRFLLSTLAYQGLKLPVAWLLALNQAARRPDLNFLLSLPFEVAAARRARRGGPHELYDADKTQRDVAASYDRLAASSLPVGAVHQVDAELEEAQLTETLLGALAQRGWLDPSDKVCV